MAVSNLQVKNRQAGIAENPGSINESNSEAQKDYVSKFMSVTEQTMDKNSNKQYCTKYIIAMKQKYGRD